VTTDETRAAALRADFEALRARGKQATDEGRLPEALELYQACVDTARELGDQHLIDLAFCNRCAVLIALGSHEGLVRDLREILSRSANRLNRLIAAYHLARIYELRNDLRKGLLYSRIARGEQQKRGVPDPYWEAGLHNQMGNFLILESRFAEAAQEYRRALAADPGAAEVRLAATWLNLGYCSLLLGDHRRGIGLIYRSLRVHRRYGAVENQMQAHLELCYGLLEVGRHGQARRHGERALALGERLGDSFGIKNALYLLGEAEHLLGDDDRARACFDRLQSLFPDTPFLTDMLMAVDLRQMINLRA
jgi:tetratricopeptide (TPR) repeat protein